MAAIDYSEPRWIGIPADPAAHYQAGFALGTHLGAQQAAQAFQQQQLARELQKDEFERQSQMAMMQLKVDEAARQHRANAAYQTMIARGIDPMEALKSVGPEMGIDPSRVMAMQEQRAERQAQQADLQSYRQAALDERRQQDKASQERWNLDREERKRSAQERESLARNKMSGVVVPEVQVIEGKKYIVNPRTGKFEEINKSVSRDSFLSQHIGQWMANNIGITPEEAAKSMNEFYDKFMHQGGESTAPGAPGAQTTPAATTNQVKQIGGFRVKVK